MWETGEKSGMWEIRAKNLGKWDITFVSPLPVPTRGQATSTLPVDYDRGPPGSQNDHIIKPRVPTMDYGVTCVCGHGRWSTS